MDLKNYLKEKWFDRVKQYALPASFRQVARAMIRPLYLKNEDIVLAIIDHRPKQCDNDRISILTPSVIDAGNNKWGLPKERLDRLRALLTNKDCAGFIVEKDGQLAAYAFVQFTGIYNFGRSGSFLIPNNFAVLKNLYVFSQFRGGSIGKDLNLKRLSSILEGATPLGFVIPENRYALRNLKMFGFTEIVKVKRTTWLYRFTKQKVTTIMDIPISDQVRSGLQAISNEA